MRKTSTFTLNRCVVSATFLLMMVWGTQLASAEQQRSTAPAKPAPVRVHLDIQPRGDIVNAVLTFENISKEPVYIDKMMAGIDQPQLIVPVFRVKADDKDIRYRGILVNVHPPGPEGYVLLDPGKSLQNTVRIDKAYGFLQGTHRYTARYVAAHGNPKNNGDVNHLQSNEASFELTVK